MRLVRQSRLFSAGFSAGSRQSWQYSFPSPAITPSRKPSRQYTGFPQQLHSPTRSIMSAASFRFHVLMIAQKSRIFVEILQK
jgi:hypothetical protein